MRMLLGLLLVAGLADDKDFFPTKKGTKWIYTAGDMEITVSVDGTEKVGDVECSILKREFPDTTTREFYSVTEKGVSLHKIEAQQTMEFKDNAIPRVRFGTKKGDTWEWKAEGQEGKYENAGEEEITVPAGKYKTLKIVVNAKGGGSEYKITRWYASGVGLIKEESVRGDQSFVMELKKFEEVKEERKDK